MLERALVVSLQGIGNAILALPLARRLAAAGQEVTLLTLSPRAVPILSRAPFLAEVIAAGDARYGGALGKAHLLADLRRRRFARALFAFPSGGRAYRLAQWAGIPRRLGHRHEGVGRAVAALTDVLEPVRGGHDLEQNRRLTDALGLSAPPGDDWPILPVPDDLRERAAAYLTSRGLDPRARYLGLHTGCDGAWVEKRWPERHFARLAAAVHREYGLPAIVFDGPAEPGSGRMVARLAGTPVHALDGWGDLADAWGLLALCDLFVSNDSGLMNLAAAAGVPTVAVFGPSRPERTRPYGPHGRAVVSDRVCAPCFGLGRYPGCPYPYHHCLAGLSPDLVLAAIAELRRP